MLKIYFLFHIRYTVDERTGRPKFFIKITWRLVFAWGFKTTTIKLLFSRELFYIYILGCTLITFKHIFSTVLLINPGTLRFLFTYILFQYPLNGPCYFHIYKTGQNLYIILLHIGISKMSGNALNPIIFFVTTTFSVIMWGSLKVLFESVCMGFYSKFYELL